MLKHQAFADIHDLDVIMVGGTHLKLHHNASLPRYHMYWWNRETPKGDVAIYVKRDLAHHPTALVQP